MPPPYDFTGPDAEAERERMRQDYAIRTDSRGRRVGPNGRYISPVAFGEAPPADTTGIFRSRPRWNSRTGRWETPIDWTNILNTATAAALTGGAANAAAGAGAAATSALPTSPAYTNLGIQAGMGGGSAALPTSAAYTNLGIQAGMRGAPTVAGGAAGASGWRGRIGNIARTIFGGGNGGGNASWWQNAALAALAGLPALVAARNSGMSDEERALYALLTRDLEDQRQDRGPERALRETQLRRINYQNPLYQAVSQLAMNRLPMNVQQPFGEF